MAQCLSWCSPNSCSDLVECWSEGEGLGEREGPSETPRIVLQSPLFIELPGRLHAITQKLIIKRLQEALQKTLGIDSRSKFHLWGCGTCFLLSLLFALEFYSHPNICSVCSSSVFYKCHLSPFSV